MVVNCLFHRMKVKVFPIIIFAMFELSISAQPLTVRVAPYYQGRNAALSLTFDDGLQERYALLRPELNRRGLRGTFAIIGSKVGSMMRSSQDKAMGISGAERQKVKRFLSIISIGERWTAVMPAHIMTLAIMKCMTFFCFKAQSSRRSFKLFILYLIIIKFGYKGVDFAPIIQ